MRGLRRSHFEEGRFGVRAARVEAVTADDLAAILAFCSEESVELLIARCDAGDTAAAQAIEEAGGRLMDTLVYFERDLIRHPAESGLADPRVRPALPEDREAVTEIARASFSGYAGHYHADPRLPREASDAAYAEWAERSLAGDGADLVVVADVDGEVLAFGTFAMEAEARCNAVLNAVAPAGRGRGLLRAILASGMAWSSTAGARSFFSSTQIGNLAPQKTWARLGMEPAAAMHTFHLWL